MKPGIRLIYFILFAMFCVNMDAQDFTATLSRNKVGAGERFRLTYIIRNKNMESLTLPKLSDFSLVGGPYQSTSTQIINGNYSMSSTVAYDLSCMKPGSYIIGGATLKSGGQNFVSNSVEIEITKEAQGGGQPKQQAPRQDPFNPFGGQQQQQPAQEVKITKDDLFIITTLSKSSVYPGEAVTVTFKLYTKFNQINIEDIKFPEYRDAWMNELKESGDKAFSRQSYNGQTYNAATLQKSLFIPQKAGNIDIKAVTARVLVQFTQRSGNFWEDFFSGGRTQQKRLDVTGNKTVLKVKEYPETDKPANFNGATGNFTMEVSADKDSVAVNDAVTIKVTVSGSGNLSLLSAPILKLPNVFESYEPKSSEKTSVKPTGVSGSKTFEYLAIPRAPGKFKLEPIQFSYFNPETGRYNTLTSDTIKLKVTGDVSGGAVVDASGRISENLADDIRYIKNNFDQSDALTGFFPSFTFFALIGLLFSSTVGLWFFRTKIWDLRNDTDRKKGRIADSVAVKRLKKAEEFLKKGDKKHFYEECYRAVIQYLQDRMGLQLSEISGAKVKVFLMEKGIAESLANEAEDIANVCEMARFAPPGSATELSDFHTRCIRFISNMEKK